jgi:hypothetical protein
VLVAGNIDGERGQESDGPYANGEGWRDNLAGGR